MERVGVEEKRRKRKKERRRKKKREKKMNSKTAREKIFMCQLHQMGYLAIVSYKRFFFFVHILYYYLEFEVRFISSLLLVWVFIRRFHTTAIAAWCPSHIV